MSVIIEAADRWFLRVCHNGSRFKAFGDSADRQREVDCGSKNLSQLVRSVPHYSSWNTIGTSSLPGVHTMEHSSDLHTCSECQDVHRWYWCRLGLCLSHLKTCKEMVELLGQVTAGAGGWIFGALKVCEVLDALPDAPEVPIAGKSL